MENAKRWAKFLREKPPYNLFEIETEDFRFLASEFAIKMEAFCDKCGKERIFKCYNKDGIKSIKGELLENTPQPTQTSREPYKSKEHFIEMEFVCDYCEDIHRKLKLVEDNEQVIPIEFETEKNMIYSVLSKGVHEYEEEECYELYPTLEYIIMSILDIELEKKNRNKKIKEIKKQIATKRTEDKGVESIVDENE